MTAGQYTLDQVLSFMMIKSPTRTVRAQWYTAMLVLSCSSAH